MQMRRSGVLRKLRNGEVACSFKINLADPRSVDIAAMYGFDCVWLDMEHVPIDWQAIENQVRSAKVYDVDSLVRVAKGSYSDYIRPLEADAAGIMIPHVMNLAEAKEIVRQTRFHPIGRRPVDGGNADGGYTGIDLREYLATANKERFVGVQIEDPEPLDELEEIAKLDGIDMLFFGPADFSQGIGAPGEWDHPLIKETRKRIADVARAKGKFAGTTGSPDSLGELVDLGYRFVNVGADVYGLVQYCKQVVAAINEFKANSD